MAIVFEYITTMRQADKLDELAQKLKNIANDDLEEILMEVDRGWKGENARKFLDKGDRMRNKVLTSSQNLKNIADTMRKMANNIKESEERAARLASMRTGDSAQDSGGN